MTVFGAAFLFLGLGVMVDSIGAKFKSDEKALYLIKQARIAIGGDAALAEIKGLSIKGSSTHTFDIDGIAKTESGESEIVMQLSGILSRRVSIGDKQMEAVDGSFAPTKGAVMTTTDKQVFEFTGKHIEGAEAGRTKVVVRASGENGEAGSVPAKIIVRGEMVDDAGNVVKVVPVEGKPLETRNVIIVKKDGSDAVYTATEDGKMTVDGKEVKVRSAAVAKPNKNNELARLALMLLLTPPKGMDIAYTFAGEGNIGGIDVNTIEADLGGSSFRLHLDRYTNVPVAINYTENAVISIIARKADNGEITTENVDVKGKAVFVAKADAAKGTDRQVRLGDFRSVNGVLLPYQWTTYSDDTVKDTFTVASYEVNPPDMPIVKGRVMKIENQK